MGPFDDPKRNALESSYDIWRRLSEQVKELLVPVKPLTQQKKGWISKFWDTILSESGPPNLNFAFGSDGKNLAHLVRLHDEARRRIDGGFSAFNARDSLGEHCLFTVARTYASDVITLFVADGADQFSER